MKLDHNHQAFFALVKAGLWEQDVHLSQFGLIDFNEVYRLAEEQSVVGLVAAGIEHVVDIKVPQQIALTFVGRALQLEQRNLAMNDYVAKLIEQLRKEDIYALLVKGQGIAQCYKRPQWRSSGDIDLLLSDVNYEKAKTKLLPIAYNIQRENLKTKHMALSIKGFEVELHGKIPFLMSKRVDDVIDEVLKNSLVKDRILSWRVNNTEVLLPNADNHIIIIFTHYLHHFFIEGVGLRQICDWCRLLWTYKDSLDYELLESRIRKMGLMSEWMVFSAMVVETLGMPSEAIPFYKECNYHKRKADRVLSRIIKSGNFGHNNDLSYRLKFTGFKYKLVSFWRRFFDFIVFMLIFPLDAPRFFVNYVCEKAK